MVASTKEVSGSYTCAYGFTAALAQEHGFTPFEQGLNEGQFARLTYEDLFLGSQGKRVGTLFGGADDFELLTPNFDTAFTFTVAGQGTVRSGSMEETILFPERVAKKDYYNGNPYTYYSGGDYGLLTIVNHLNTDGPVILLVRDSMACAVTPFMASACSTLVQVDTRYYDGDPAQLALQLGVDMVVVLRG